MAVEEADNAVCLEGLFLVVSHHHYGSAVVAVQVVEEAHDFLPVVGVEVSGRFVGENYLGVADDGAGYGYALALST